ncbi:hypothetical protein RSOL_421230 [Rhizoctonia solani AG-3 Rhs1AP]|uniref:Uncharacterized protein n=1 Tax=Rhizoctonia solani AG-3 Rhs1AP TaxID=1086054 RepID=X8JES4_9AGAM|nr:hypothetical protein RSOL_421230 [Rhizoctonia solani AG-3 Rhs1AP]
MHLSCLKWVHTPSSPSSSLCRFNGLRCYSTCRLWPSTSTKYDKIPIHTTRQKSSARSLSTKKSRLLNSASTYYPSFTTSTA